MSAREFWELVAKKLPKLNIHENYGRDFIIGTFNTRFFDMDHSSSFTDYYLPVHDLKTILRNMYGDLSNEFQVSFIYKRIHNVWDNLRPIRRDYYSRDKLNNDTIEALSRSLSIVVTDNGKVTNDVIRFCAAADGLTFPRGWRILAGAIKDDSNNVEQTGPLTLKTSDGELVTTIQYLIDDDDNIMHIYIPDLYYNENFDIEWEGNRILSQLSEYTIDNFNDELIYERRDKPIKGGKFVDLQKFANDIAEYFTNKQSVNACVICGCTKNNMCYNSPYIKGMSYNSGPELCSICYDYIYNGYDDCDEP